MTPTEYARLGVYLASVALGVFMAALGAIRGDGALVTTGLGLVGVGSTAGGALGRQISRGRHAA